MSKAINFNASSPVRARTDTTTDRARLDEHDRLLLRAHDREYAADGGHHEEGALEALLAQPVFEAADVILQARANIGVRRCRRGTLDIRTIRVKLGSGRDVDAGKLFAQIRDRRILGDVNRRRS